MRTPVPTSDLRCSCANNPDAALTPGGRGPDSVAPGPARPAARPASAPTDNSDDVAYARGFIDYAPDFSDYAHGFAADFTAPLGDGPPDNPNNDLFDGGCAFTPVMPRPRQKPQSPPATPPESPSTTPGAAMSGEAMSGGAPGEAQGGASSRPGRAISSAPPSAAPRERAIAQRRDPATARSESVAQKPSVPRERATAPTAHSPQATFATQATFARQIVRPVEILKGVRSIAAFLGVSQAEVLRLESRGAPMRRKNNIIRAEKAELWEWWKQA